MILQCPKKVSVHPETGPEFPQNHKNPKLCGTNLFLSEFSILFLMFRFFWQAVINFLLTQPLKMNFPSLVERGLTWFQKSIATKYGPKNFRIFLILGKSWTCFGAETYFL